MFNPTPLLLVVLAPPALTDDPRVAGAEACAPCHRDHFDAWRRTPHAAAWERLPAQRRDDLRCVGCHTEGLAEAVRGVQCETCHGPADTHPPERAAAVAVRRGRRFMQVPDAVCFRCHTADAPRDLALPGDRGRIHRVEAAP